MDVAEVVAHALAQAPTTIVLADRSSAVNCRWANNTLTTNGQEASLSASVVAIDEGRVGMQSSDVVGLDDVARAAHAAGERARQSPPAADAFELVPAGPTVPEGPVDAPASADDLGPLVEPLRRTFEAAARDGWRCFGFAQATVEETHLGSVTGLRAAGARRVATVSMTVKSPDYQRSVWMGRLGTSFAGLDAAQLYSQALERLRWGERRLELPAGRYQVILEPSAVADLLARLYWEMHARGADEGKTVFASPKGSRAGERLYARGVTVTADPGAAGMEVPAFIRAPASTDFASVFDNGLPVPPAAWIREGVQGDLVCPRAWARDHDHPARPEVDNLRMAGTATELEAMIESTERALLISSLWYIRDLDPTSLLLTGLTRDGVYLVEHGRVQGAVNNFRFNDSPVRVLANTVEIGRPEMALSREIGGHFLIEAPPIRVEDFHLSSVSDAV